MFKNIISVLRGALSLLKEKKLWVSVATALLCVIIVVQTVALTPSMSLAAEPTAPPASDFVFDAHRDHQGVSRQR